MIDALNARELAAGAADAVRLRELRRAGWPTCASANTSTRARLAVPLPAAKRAVEAQLGIKGPAPEKIRPVIVRPSFIWNWKKLDILPLIPVFNTASALGVPFVDKTVRVETLAKALVAGIDDGAVSGVKRYMDMEALAERLG